MVERRQFFCIQANHFLSEDILVVNLNTGLSYLFSSSTYLSIPHFSHILEIKLNH